MASLLSQQFNSVCSKPTNPPTLNYQSPIASTNNISRCISDIEFNHSDFVKAIDELSPNAASGPDGFPSILLKKCKHSLAVPLTLLWRK